MDFVSHALIGRAIAEFNTAKKKDVIFISSFAVLPDITQLLLYPYLGYIKNRPFFLPNNEDWNGFSLEHPFLTSLYLIPHSILFLGIVIIPMIYFFKLHKLCILSYFSHIFIDIFSHTGEWSTQFLYPIKTNTSGFTDGWALPLKYLVISWIILIFVIVLIKFLKNNLWKTQPIKK